MKATDLKVGDIITNNSSSSIALTAKIKSIRIEGGFVLGFAEIITLRKGVKWADLLSNECRFKYNKKTDLKNILV